MFLKNNSNLHDNIQKFNEIRLPKILQLRHLSNKLFAWKVGRRFYNLGSVLTASSLYRTKISSHVSASARIRALPSIELTISMLIGSPASADTSGQQHHGTYELSHCKAVDEGLSHMLTCQIFVNEIFPDLCCLLVKLVVLPWPFDLRSWAIARCTHACVVLAGLWKWMEGLWMNEGWESTRIGLSAYKTRNVYK